jgi:S1-C subfamily serine protease
VLVLKVLPGTSAEQAGLRGTTQVGDGLVLGDIILAVNGRKVTDYDSLRDEVERYEVGATVVLTLLRDDATAEVSVRLEALQ